MYPADVWICFVDTNGNVQVSDRKTTGYASPIAKTQQNLEILGGNVTNGVTTCVFRRMLNTGNVNDPIISNTILNVIYAQHSYYKPTSSSAQLVEHDGTKGEVQINFLINNVSPVVDDALATRITHGVFMFVSWGVAIPVGALLARYLRLENKDNVIWFKIHRLSQPIGYFLAIVGFIIALAMVKVQFALAHSYFGLIVMILGFGQVLWAILRPHKEEPKTGLRKKWEKIHIWVGRTLPVLGYITIFIGLGAISAHWVIIVLVVLFAAALVAFVIFKELQHRDIICAD